MSAAAHKSPCHFCRTPCWHVCYIGHLLACVECFNRLAVQPALAVKS